MEKIIKILSIILTFIVLLPIMLGLTYFINFNKNKCIENGGKVITDTYGLYDKCIYGDK